jgi:hypothetical protein
VLNSLRSCYARGSYDRLDPVAVCLVGKLARECDAQVVISSAWRIIHKLEEIKGFLAEYDSELASRVTDMTPVLAGVRGIEIKKWLQSTGVSDYVIIDDNSDMLGEQAGRFVKTAFHDGFLLRDYKRAVAILKPSHPDAYIGTEPFVFGEE